MTLKPISDLPEIMIGHTNRRNLTWKRSQVLEPSPQGVLRVVMRKVLVGMRTGP